MPIVSPTSETPESLAARTFTLLTKQFEGFSEVPYQDVKGVWTIGYGSTIDASNKPITEASIPVTRADAGALARRDLVASATAVGAYVLAPLNANQGPPLVDFIYNLGRYAFAMSTLRRKLNDLDYAGASAEFLRWDHAGSHIEPGLSRRCVARQKLFNTPDLAPTSILGLSVNDNL